MKLSLKYFTFLFSSFLVVSSASAVAPIISCWELPGCDGDARVSETSIYGIIWWVIASWIQYVAVIAVIAVMYGGIMYLLSSGEEEKTKKAKNIIIWALAWVFVSVLAWSIIQILNNFRI
jgi:hypothetical protein